VRSALAGVLQTTLFGQLQSFYFQPSIKLDEARVSAYSLGEANGRMKIALWLES
jgi:hypothetical protein